MGPFDHIHGAACAGCSHDESKRRRAFEQAHPEWRIIWDRDYRVWRAWRLLDGGEDNLTRYELAPLLDALESRL